MEQDVSIRLARRDEQTMLESLQRRASLSNPGDRDALLAHPDAIALPVEQIVDGSVFVAERDGAIAGFADVSCVPWQTASSIKSIVKIAFVEKEPINSWRRAASNEYGFCANVNPAVDHPRWSHATERRLPSCSPSP